MLGKATVTCLMMIALLLLIEAPMIAVEYQILFDFGKSDSAKEWQAVNDSVMGGISNGRFNISEEGTMEFFGTLSLENNGGFASVRSRPKNLNLKMGDTLAARVRGDGREYSFNLYTQSRMTAFSYRTMFTTKKNEWIEIHLPLDKFVATSFGEIVNDQPLDPDLINGIGFLLSDKKAGQFKLEINWIKVIKAK